MRIAAIADIHGNLPALDAVLADIAACGADVTVNLGDIVSGPLWPVETAEPSHLPRSALTADGVLVVNPGSVGLPAYGDALPHRHRVENGAPHARWALLSSGSTGWHVEWRAVPYDWETAAQQAERHDRPDWAHALRTGWAAV